VSAHEYTPQAKKRCAHKMKAARAKLAADEVLLVWYCPRDIAAGDVQMLPVARADASSALSALLKCHNVSSTQYPETLAFDWLLATLDADGQAEDSYCCNFQNIYVG